MYGFGFSLHDREREPRTKITELPNAFGFFWFVLESRKSLGNAVIDDSRQRPKENYIRFIIFGFSRTK